MELVLVERQFPDPVRFEDIQSLEDAGSWCLEAHRVRALKTFFSRDRRRMLCLYQAPDAEAVRLAQSEAKVPYDRVWTCENLRGREPDAASNDEYVVAERLFPEPVTREFVSNAFQRASSCLDLHSAKYVESFLGCDGLRMVCLFRAPDAEAVRLANQMGRVPYVEIWTANVYASPHT